MYKARIKILVHEIGVEEFRRRVEEEWEQIKDGRGRAARRRDRAHRRLLRAAARSRRCRRVTPAFERSQAERCRRSPAGRGPTCIPHKQPGYAIVNISLKPHRRHPGRRHRRADGRRRRPRRALQLRRDPGDARAEPGPAARPPGRPLRALAGAASRSAWRRPTSAPSPTSSPAPGLDYCSLANARSIPIAQRHHASASPTSTAAHDVGELKIKISGCINACGHHHVGHIGILGVDKKGEEFYQITLGGDAAETAALGAAGRPGLRRRRRRRCGRDAGRHLPRPAPATASASSTPTAASASSRSRRSSMPLIKDGRLVDDLWTAHRRR